MSAFDDRIFKVVLTWPSPGSTTSQEQLTIDSSTSKLPAHGGLYIRAQGTKYYNATQNECTVQIGNLKRETRDALATQLTFFNYSQARKTIKLYAGRVSTGLFLLYSGDIIECTPSQPPDIVLTIKSKTMQWFKMNIVAQAQNLTAPMSQIAGGIAQSLGVPIKFEATDKNISNWSYSGSAAGQVDKFNELGGINAYVDNDWMVVKDAGKPLANSIHTLSADSGMIGVPQLTEVGIRVKMLLQPTIVLGGQLSLKSVLNPSLDTGTNPYVDQVFATPAVNSLNGNYEIYKVGFDIASRDVPFYGIAECSRYPVLYGNADLPNV